MITTGEIALNRDRPSLLSGEEGFVEIDRRWIQLSRMVNLMVFAVIGGANLLLGLLLLLALPPIWDLLVLVVWAALLCWFAFGTIWWPRLQYQNWSYRTGGKVFELCHGVVWRTRVAIPISRLQHVDVHRGPFERRYGLASLELHTAGTRNASHTVPGLDASVADALRDQLIDAANRGSRG